MTSRTVEPIITAAGLVALGGLILALALFPFGEVHAQGYLSQGLPGIALLMFWARIRLGWVLSALALGLAWPVSATIRRLYGRVVVDTGPGLRWILAAALGLGGGGILVTAALAGTLGLLHVEPLLPWGMAPPGMVTAAFALLLMTVLCLHPMRRLARNRGFRAAAGLGVLVSATAAIVGLIVGSPAGPNVLLVVVDTLRADHTAVSAPASTTTPALRDTLMADGVSFPRVYANAPWTLPSIASLLTSRYPSSLQVHDMDSRLAPTWPTMAEFLANRGYRTGGIISHIFLQKEYGLGQGFDRYDEEVIDRRHFNHFTVTSQAVTRKAVRFIGDNRRQPFFLFLHYFDPHQSYFDHDKSFPYHGAFRWGTPLEEMVRRVARGEFADEDIRYLTHCYDSEIRFVDRHVGRVVQELKRQGIYDQTLVIFVSDHGEEFVERDFLGHGTSLYDEQLRVPLVVKPPADYRVPPESQPMRAVSNLDILPTVFDVLGMPVDPRWEGTSVFSGITRRRDIFAELRKTQFGMKRDRLCLVRWPWKLIRDVANSSHELYHLEDDPGERCDVSGLQADVRRRLEAALEAWIASHRGETGETPKARLSDEERRRLKSLGYF